ncbi:hypothetical protein ABIC27_001136 [Streptomyces sp. PvR034]
MAVAVVLLRAREVGWWREAGCPGPERFGLTVTPEGTHVPWLDAPDHPVPDLT